MFHRTKRNLHSHTQKAPMTPANYQVTGYGEVSLRFFFSFFSYLLSLSISSLNTLFNPFHLHISLSLSLQDGVGDANDIWVVEIQGGTGSGDHGDQVRTVTSILKLRHLHLGCYLHSHSTQLPKW